MAITHILQMHVGTSAPCSTNNATLLLRGTLNTSVRGCLADGYGHGHWRWRWRAAAAARLHTGEQLLSNSGPFVRQRLLHGSDWLHHLLCRPKKISFRV